MRMGRTHVAVVRTPQKSIVWFSMSRIHWGVAVLLETP